jgi:hypothetical protein
MKKIPNTIKVSIGQVRTKIKRSRPYSIAVPNTKCQWNSVRSFCDLICGRKAHATPRFNNIFKHFL